MFSKFTSTLFLITTTLTLQANDCCCNSSEQENFYVYGDYLYLSRSEDGGPNRNLIYGDNNAAENISILTITRPQSIAMKASSFDLGHHSGFRVGLGFRCCDIGGEANFLYLGTQHAKKSLSAGDYSLGTQLQNNSQNIHTTNDNTLVASVDNLHRVTEVAAQLLTKLHGFEVNFNHYSYTGSCGYGGAVCGIRGLSIEEDICLNLTTAGGLATYKSKADNHIIGLQAGYMAGAERTFCGNFQAGLTLTGKAGIGFNSADLAIDLINADLLANPGAPDDSSTNASCFGEISTSLSLGWKNLVARVGYTLIIVDSVELGGVPSDLFLIGASPITASQRVCYHGLSTGIGCEF